MADAAAPPAPTLSVVIPCRNEEANVEPIARAVLGELERSGESFEIIFIDNASTDRTVEIARGLCARDPRIKLIVNAGNFGQLRSPTYGIYQARGQAVIAMCADFQDPPELIPEFIEQWRAGYRVVLGVRQSEPGSLWLRVLRSLAYFLGRWLFDHPLIPNATGFGLFDRRVLDVLSKLNEPEPLFRGLLVEFDFPTKTIAFKRPARARGKSNNNFFTLADFVLSAVAASGKRLLRLPFVFGLISMVFSLGLVVAASLGAATPAFWPLVLWAVLQFNFGILFVICGLVGDQIRLLAERSRGTPLVVEAERVNFDR